MTAFNRGLMLGKMKQEKEIKVSKFLWICSLVIFIIYVASQQPSSNKKNVMLPADEVIKMSINKSDDYKRNESAFLNGTKKILSMGKCSLNDITEQGGWTKSMFMKQQPVYFIYCDGMHMDYKLYLNLTTGEIFKKRF